MMKKHTVCPECEAGFGFKPAMIGQTIRCQTCSHLFVVQGPPDDSPAPLSAVSDSAPPALPPSRQKAQDDDRVRGSRNSRRRKQTSDDDEEDAPRSKAAKYRDLDDEAGGGVSGKPARKSSDGVGRVLILAFCGIGFILISLGGVIYLLWPKGKPPQAEVPNVASRPTANQRGPVPPAVGVGPQNIDDILNPFKNNPPVVEPRIPNLFNKPNPNQVLPVPVPELRDAGLIVVKPLFPATDSSGSKPVVFANNTLEIVAPHAISQVVPSGSGKYLLLLHQTQQKVSVLEVSSAKILKTLLMDQQIFLIAGGSEFFVAYYPRTNEWQRFSLKTLQGEQTVRNPIAGEIATIGMGAASNGPLVICLKAKSVKFPDRNQIRFLNPNTMAALNTPIGGRDVVFPLGTGDKPISIQVSANGGMFTAWTKEFPAGIYSYVFEPNGMPIRYFEHIGPRTLYPSGDGRFLFSEGRIYGPDAKPLTEEAGGHGHKIWYLPAVNGSEYLMLEEQKIGFDESKLIAQMRSTANKQTTPISTLTGTDGMVDWRRGKWLGIEQMIFLIPEANVLAVFPPSQSDRVIFCKLK